MNDDCEGCGYPEPHQHGFACERSCWCIEARRHLHTDAVGDCSNTTCSASDLGIKHVHGVACAEACPCRVMKPVKP